MEKAGASVKMQLGNGESGTLLAAVAFWRNSDGLSVLVDVGAEVGMQVPCGHYSSALVTAVASDLESEKEYFTFFGAI